MKPSEYKAKFIAEFNSLCGRHSKFTVWSDFVHMVAYTISNACDFRQDREERYLSIVQRYSEDELNKMVELFALTVLALDSNRHQDFLGQLYMENGFGDNRKGEYFTPYNLAVLMSKLVDNDDCEKSGQKGYVTVNDPACGSGVMLIAFANNLNEAGVNHHLKMFVVANDINPCIALMCYIQLSLLGCAGYVCISNTITNPITGDVLYPPEDAFVMPMFFHPVWRVRRALGQDVHESANAKETVEC